MLTSVTNSPNSGIYPFSSAEDSALFASLAKETAEHIVKTNQEFVDDFGSRFFHRAIEEGVVIGPNGQPVKPSPEQIKAWFSEYKENFLNQLLSDEKARLKESSQQHFAEAARLKESSQQHFAEAARLKESSQKKFAQAEKERQDALTKQFWSIFNAKDSLLQEEYGKVFATYLADRSLTIEKTDDNKCFARINLMSSVIKYIKANPLTKACDFRAFKTEINDVETLADFLKTSDAFAIRGVAFKSGISEIAKEKIAEAVSARAATKFPLKAQYFA